MTGPVSRGLAERPMSLVPCPGLKRGGTCGHEHDPRRCTGHVDEPNGTVRPCKQFPIRGGAVCRDHGGAAGHVRAAAARRLALGEAMGELERLGVPIDVEPADAMLEMVREAAGNVAFLRRRIQELDQLLGGPEGNEIIAVLGGAAKDAGPLEIPAGPPAIAARVDPRNFRAERHVLVAMYDDERERLVRWAKACRDAGVDERRVQLAEDQGRQLAAVLRGTLEAVLALVVGLVDPAVAAVVRERWAAEVPAIVRRQISTVTGVGA